MKYSSDKWLQLINPLQIIGKSEVEFSETDFDIAEKELKLKFPSGYKDFCRVFGAGMLNNHVRLYCPYNSQSRFDIRNHLWQMEALQDELSSEKDRFRKGIPCDVNDDLIKLLDRISINGITFADTGNANIFIWDLYSYSETDQSYDIFMTTLDGLRNTELVGRDFYHFIKDYCLDKEFPI